ncbi:MAG: TetR/AcrR family transcriptional regulator [Oscillospiraceae bacterium]|jgi:AcrR family transcriptional regulator|nr:TetR/AcrR family transcriptional regulator [Oscillospiraceae bacterium]
MEFPLVDLSSTRDTKERILLVAVQLFAKRGYVAVSVRDIAKMVGIKASSLYYHYDSKDEIFTDILNKIESVYNDYYTRLDAKISQTTSLREMVECMFSELMEVYHMFIYYGVTVLSVEQFRDERARRLYNDVYMKRGIDYMRRAFDYCIEKQWVAPFDSGALATMIMNSVASGSLIHALEGMGYETVYKAGDMFRETKEFVLSTLQ